MKCATNYEMCVPLISHLWNLADQCVFWGSSKCCTLSCTSVGDITCI